MKRYLISELSERERIHQKKACRPYGASMMVRVRNPVCRDDLFGILNKACLLIDETLIITVELIEDLSNKQCAWYRVSVDAFENPMEAGSAGMRLATALLWTSISVRDLWLMLDQSGSRPYVIYDRRFGSSVTESILSSGRSSVECRHGVFAAAWVANITDDRIHLAMSLYCSARFETTLRAKFIGLISCLEPLATQLNYGEEEYGATLKDFIRKSVSSASQLKDIPENVRESIKGQLRNLKRESIRQAHRRLARKYLEDGDSVRALEEAYQLRSEMLHEGGSHPDLQEIVWKVEGLIARIFAGILELPLVANR